MYLISLQIIAALFLNMTYENVLTGNRSNIPITFQPPTTPYVLGVVFSILAIVLNGFLLLVMVKERTVFFHTRVSYFVINLAVADCLTGVSLTYLELRELLKLKTHPALIPMVVLFNWTTVQCSFFTLLLMSVNWLIMVLYPLRWSNILTVRRTLTSVAAVWLVSIAGGVMLHFHKAATQLVILSFVELCTLLFICNSLFIYPVLRKREQCRYTSGDPSQSFERPPPTFRDKMSTVVVILMVVLIVTQLPFVTCFQIMLADSLFDKNVFQKIDVLSLYQAYSYTQAFACLNFVVNPIVYAWRIRTYRKAFTRTLKCCNN